jgi:hypothetical protein
MDADVLAELLDAADETERQRIWRDLVAKAGAETASQMWLAHFAATDTPVTG